MWDRHNIDHNISCEFFVPYFCLISSIDENDKDCIAVSQELSSGNVISVAVKHGENCTTGDSCYQMNTHAGEYDCTDLCKLRGFYH